MNSKNILCAVSALAMLSMSSISTVMAADDGDVQFDTGILKNRGLDAGLGRYFSESARFTPGTHTVNVKINGRDVGQLSPRFGSTGNLCVTEAFLLGAGMVVPDDVAQQARKEETRDGSPTDTEEVCYDYLQDYPTAVITPLPGQNALSLTVPPEAVDNTSTGSLARHYRTGGTAGLLNYQAFSTTSEFGGQSTAYNQAMLEEGVNVQDWLLRSRQSLTWNDGQHSTDNLYTYAQRTLVPLKKQLQVGQINTTSSLLSGIALTGIQLSPEEALSKDEGSGVQVTGIARGAQARVDIRQLGRIVYSTLVPAGAFTLTDVPVTSTNTDLDVTVTETDGNQNHYIIPASAINGDRLASPEGISLALGRYRDEGDSDEAPWLASISDGWRLRPWLNAGVGMMTAQQFTALAASVDTLPLKGLTLSGTVKVSDDERGHNRGQSATLNMSYSLAQNFGLNASATRYDGGFRNLADTLTDDFTQYSGQYAGSIHWSHPVLGAFSLGYTLSQGTEGSSDSRYVNASWGKNIGKASVSVTWQTQVNQDQDDDGNNHCCTSTNNGDMVYANISVPLGSQNVSFYSRTRDHETTAGAQASGNFTDNNSYSVSAERDTRSSEYDFSGSSNNNLHYTQLGINAGTQGRNGRNYGATLNGGIAVHSGGVTFSPWAIRDTFGIVDAGKEASGAEISTPSGPVWIDRWGQAVIPSVPAYRNTRVEMDTTTLPENVDVSNGFAQLAAGRGSVSKINFNVLNVRRVMMHVRMNDCSALKKGASVTDKHGNYIATVVDDGLMFLDDASGLPDLYVTSEQGIHLCQIHYSLPESSELRVAYEQLTGVCQ